MAPTTSTALVDAHPKVECASAESPAEQIAVPNLLVHGSDTALAWLTDFTRYAAEHVP
ncbi:MAG TPA: hypothetical protein VK902_15135 [Rubrobacter sp.]|nr:hypothetical protein [Rubrobacter sp.]